MAAAVPAAIAIGSSFAGRKMGGGQGAGQGGYDNDLNPRAREALMSARQTREQGGSIFSSGAPLLQAAAGYYQKLLGGDRTAINQAVAPQRLAVNETFKGQREGINYGPLRGGARDMALAESDRTRAGVLGTLVPNAIDQAAASGGQLALGATGQGTNATANAGSLFRGLERDQEDDRRYNNGEHERMGDQIGTFLTNLLQTYYTGRGRSGGGGASGGPPSVGGGGNMVPGTSLPGASFAGIRF